MTEKQAEIVIIGAGLAGLVAANEAAERGHSVLIIDQEGRQNLGGQAFWSLGGLFLVDSPEQRRMGIRDERDLALADWMGTAAFDRDTDATARAAAEAFIDFAAGEMRPWLHGMGIRFFPVVGWAERGGSMAHQHGNSVPRFHMVWGTGPAVLEPFVQRALEHERAGRIRFAFRHRVTRLELGRDGRHHVAGDILQPDNAERGAFSNRFVEDRFEHSARALIVTSGGIGGDTARVRRNWPTDRFGPAPEHMVCGVPAHVDGAMLDICEQAGARLVNMDRMWHYTEGLKNYAPIWPNHGIRVLPGPSSLWFDAHGRRMEAPAMPGFDTNVTMKRILSTGKPWSWFILNRSIIGKEFALSGSEQNPELTGKDWKLLLTSRLLGKGVSPVQKFVDQGEDFLTADDLDELVGKMNGLAGESLLDPQSIRVQVEARDRQIGNPFSKDAQIMAIRGALTYRGDRLVRTAKPSPILDPKNGPLIAVRMNILTRKSLGGIHTDVDARCLGEDGKPIDGLYAAGECAGFGGGGYHGYAALEGTFLGGAIFSGRTAGRRVAEDLAS